MARNGLLCAIGATALALSISSAAHAQNPSRVGSIHGVVVAEVPGPGGSISIPLPNVTVTISEATSDEPRGQAITRLTGAFATALQPAGTYKVCAAATGFAQSCSDPVQITGDSISLRRLLALRPQGGVLHGHIALQDGSAAVRFAQVRGASGGAALVSLADNGRVVAGPVSVNAGSDYVLAPATLGTNLNLSVRYEAASASQSITLTQSNLDGGTPVNVTLPSAAPRVVSVTMTQNGNAISAAAPGSTIVLTVQAQDLGPGPLHYSWTANFDGLVARDAASATVTLPTALVTTVIFVEITNGNGGVSRGSITIPLTTTPSFHPALEFIRTNNSATNNSAGNLTANVNPCLSTYCPPPHQGLFIDPALLMSSACTDETTCETEAIAYYKAIGALDASGKPTATGTFEGWKSTFGFSVDPTKPASGEVHAAYYNNADLQFGRDMHCRSNLTPTIETVACYVSNYGDAPHTFGSDPQTSVGNAASNTGRIATVAMVYSFHQQGGTQTDRVQFYVFGTLNNDANDGALLNAAALDSEGAKATPGLCLTCHGGRYDATAHKAENASFLPFDDPTYIFSTTAAQLLESSQREAIRQLNQMVETAAFARPTISQLIDGWYAWCGGVSKSGCYIDDVGHPFYPNQPCAANADPSSTSCGWPVTWGGANAQSFYQRVPRLYCRTCHVAQANYFNVNSFTDWTNQSGLIQSFVLASQSNPPQPNYMPFAQVPYNAFWQDSQAQSALAAFLKAAGP
jgi:hypothetical protein